MRVLKQPLLRLFNRFLQHPTVQAELDRQFRLRVPSPPPLRNHPSPYRELSEPGTKRHTAACATPVSPVFISSRFRSGSTLLWNLFRQLENCTAYYEPFNERQWFDTRQRAATHAGKG